MTKAEEILSKYDSYYIAENTEKERVVISYESALEAVTKALLIVGRSEQLSCPRCRHTGMDTDKDGLNYCRSCSYYWKAT